MSICILCNQNDQVGRALFLHLKSGNLPVQLITAEDLIFANSWNHEITREGKCHTEIILQNGTHIHSATIRGVFNRISFMQMPHFLNASDRNYAEMEMYALFVSFLKSMEPVLFEPLQMDMLLPGEENVLYTKQQVIKAGFPVSDYHFTTSPKWQRSEDLLTFYPQKKTGQAFYRNSPHLVWENQPALFMENFQETSRIVVAGDEILAEKQGEYTMETKRLSALLNRKYFEIELALTHEGYKVSGINHYPLHASAATIGALARFIEQKAIQLS